MPDQIGRPHRLSRGGPDALDQPRLVDAGAERHALDLEHAQRQLLVAPAGGRGAPFKLVQEAVTVEDPSRPAERAASQGDQLDKRLLECGTKLRIALAGPAEGQRTVLADRDPDAGSLGHVRQRPLERLRAGVRRRQQACRVGQSVDQRRLGHCPQVSGRRATGLSDFLAFVRLLTRGQTAARSLQREVGQQATPVGVRLAIQHLHEGIHQIGLELAVAAVQQLLDGDLGGHRPAVGPVAGHRVIGVGDRDHARQQRDLLAGQPVRVARAIEALVV